MSCTCLYWWRPITLHIECAFSTSRPVATYLYDIVLTCSPSPHTRLGSHHCMLPATMDTLTWWGLSWSMVMWNWTLQLGWVLLLYKCCVPQMCVMSGLCNYVSLSQTHASNHLMSNWNAEWMRNGQRESEEECGRRKGERERRELRGGVIGREEQREGGLSTPPNAMCIVPYIPKQELWLLTLIDHIGQLLQ